MNSAVEIKHLRPTRDRFGVFAPWLNILPASRIVTWIESVLKPGRKLLPNGLKNKP